jgi:hypothetical protein
MRHNAKGGLVEKRVDYDSYCHPYRALAARVDTNKYTFLTLNACDDEPDRPDLTSATASASTRP